MKRTDFLTKIVSLLLFGALLAYLGFYLVKGLHNDLRTAPAVRITITESASATGIVIRNETLINGSGNLSIEAKNGHLLAAGETIAVSYSGEDALHRANRIHELQAKRDYIISLLQKGSVSSAVAARDRAVKAAVIDVAFAASRGDMNLLPSAGNELAALVMHQNKETITQADLNLVVEELAQLQSEVEDGTQKITADKPGIFTSHTDGYEFLSPDKLSGFTPNSFAQLEATPAQPGENVLGKLVDSGFFYYAALLSENDAARLKEGKNALLNFGHYCTDSVTSRVISISSPENGQCAVLFRCTSSLSDLLYVRKLSAQVIFGSGEGIRIPRKAVYSDEEGTFVYSLNGVYAEKKYVTVIDETEDYFLISIEEGPSALTPSNDVIVSYGGELWDGKLMEEK